VEEEASGWSVLRFLEDWARGAIVRGGGKGGKRRGEGREGGKGEVEGQLAKLCSDERRSRSRSLGLPSTTTINFHCYTSFVNLGTLWTFRRK